MSPIKWNKRLERHKLTELWTNMNWKAASLRFINQSTIDDISGWDCYSQLAICSTRLLPKVEHTLRFNAHVKSSGTSRDSRLRLAISRFLIISPKVFPSWNGSKLKGKTTRVLQAWKNTMQVNPPLVESVTISKKVISCINISPLEAQWEFCCQEVVKSLKSECKWECLIQCEEEARGLHVLRIRICKWIRSQYEVEKSAGNLEGIHSSSIFRMAKIQVRQSVRRKTSEIAIFLVTIWDA